MSKNEFCEGKKSKVRQDYKMKIYIFVDTEINYAIMG